MPDQGARQLPSVERIFVGILVYPDPSGLDDPEMTGDRRLKSGGQRADGVLEMRGRNLRRQAQHGDAREIHGTITKRVAELEIEGDEGALLPA